jgi:lipopolysaccharide export system protein LptC
MVQNLLTASLAAVAILCSCERKNNTIAKSEILNLPTQVVRIDTTVYDDSGKVQLILITPLMERYTNTDSPYSEFREGIKVTFYEGEKEPAGSASSNYARYTDKKKLWELRDSVIVLNKTNGRLETEQLFWDQEKDMIYTDRFVEIINEDQIVSGIGFESDTRLQKRKIKNVTATIYLHEGQ